MRGFGPTLAALALAVVLPVAGNAQVPADDFYEDDYEYAVGEYYGEPVDRIPGWIDPDELPIIYLLAREARVSPRVIIALRERGWSWIDITYHLGVDPYLYVERLPYTTGYYRRYSARELRYLSDRHIIDFVNLIFWADFHRRPIHQVIIIRQRVPTWRHYARFHSPPRTVARGVYVHRTPQRATPGRSTREAVPRRAVPRDDAQRRGVTRESSARPTTDDRATRPPRSSTGTRPDQGERRDPPATRSGGATRSAVPRNADDGRVREERPAARGAATGATRSDAAPSRRDAAPSRRDAAPSRQEAAPSRRDAAPARGSAVEPRGSGATRGTAAPATRGSNPSAHGSRSGGTRRGGG